MIVIRTDPHKHSHTAGAVDAATGRAVAERTVRARRRSFEDLLLWARGLDGDRVWALEDCRHVSGALERFLLAHGEHVVRVAPKLAARERAAGRGPRASPTPSTPQRSPAPRCAKASTPCPPDGSPAPSWRSGCWPITASDSSRSALR